MLMPGHYQVMIFACQHQFKKISLNISLTHTHRKNKNQNFLFCIFVFTWLSYTNSQPFKLCFSEKTIINFFGTFPFFFGNFSDCGANCNKLYHCNTFCVFSCVFSSSCTFDPANVCHRCRQEHGSQVSPDTDHHEHNAPLCIHGHYIESRHVWSLHLED